MGIARKFIKFVKFIKCGHIFYFIALAGAFIMPGLVQAQKSANDIVTTVNGKKYYMHTVVKGETIYGIAEKFNLQPKDIILENPSAIDGVNPGDVLLIPMIGTIKKGDTTSVGKVPGNYIYHEVLPKETLYSLSKQYNTTIGAIDSLNPELSVKGLQKGQTIRIPVVTAQPVVTNKPEEKHPSPRDTVKVLPSQPQPPATKPEVKQNPEETKAYKNLVTEQTHPDTSKPLAPIKDTGKKMTRYNIALIMPFASGSTDTMRISRLLEGSELIPQTTQFSVDFYHGIILAFDSLAKKGFKANLHVYNILPGTDTSSHLIDSILKTPEMAQMNLIIGPPYLYGFRKVVLFADKRHIPVVFPAPSENSILKNNAGASKTIPSAVTETEAEADYIATHYNHANLIIVHNKDANDEYFEIFKKRFRKTDSAAGHNDSLRRAESMGTVFNLGYKISKKGINVIIVSYPGESFVAKFVNELANSAYAADDSLVLFGMHKWSSNDALAADNLDTLNCHFPSNEFVNYTDSCTKRFIAKYRNDYLSEPSYYSYEGYDAGMFYGSLLLMYGTDMQNHLGDIKYRGLQTSFDMYRNGPTTGYENKAVYIIEYKNYREKLDSR